MEDTVDGSEIRLMINTVEDTVDGLHGMEDTVEDTVDGPVDMINIPLFLWVSAPSQVVSRIPEPSTVSTKLKLPTTPPETNIAPINKLIFQQSIFRCETVSFREGSQFL